VRVPGPVGKGKVKVTLSFDEWKDGRVAPATYELEYAGHPENEAGKSGTAGD
jgi:hypothetical protein